MNIRPLERPDVSLGAAITEVIEAFNESGACYNLLWLRKTNQFFNCNRLSKLPVGSFVALGR